MYLLRSQARGLVRCTSVVRVLSRCFTAAIVKSTSTVEFRSNYRAQQFQKRSYSKLPKIGVAVTILRPIKNREDQYEVLLIKRGKQPAMDMWSSCGGHLEWGETILQGAMREMEEEICVDRSHFHFSEPFSCVDSIHATPNNSETDFHFVIVSVLAVSKSLRLIVDIKVKKGHEDKVVPKPSTDAKDAKWFHVSPAWNDSSFIESEGIIPNIAGVIQKAVKFLQHDAKCEPIDKVLAFESQDSDFTASRKTIISSSNLIPTEDIIDFWFEEEKESGSSHVDGLQLFGGRRWFSQDQQLDEYIRSKYTVELFNFVNYYKDTDIAQEVEHNKPRSIPAQIYLASIILLDQFTRNIFRGQKEAFDYDQLARKLAKYCVKHGIDKQLPEKQRSFIYMPYMHSESIADQDEGVKLFEELKHSLKDESPEQKKFVEASLSSAEYHRRLIREFGRFPRRNEALNRQSTERELNYLKSK